MGGKSERRHIPPASLAQPLFDAEIEVWLSGHWDCVEKEGGDTQDACGMRWWLLRERERRGLTFPIPTRESPPGAPPPDVRGVERRRARFRR